MTEKTSGTATEPMTDRLRSQLARLLDPRTIAVVGLSDRLPGIVRDVGQAKANGADIYIVNPRHSTVMGLETVGSLSDIPGPIDAVMSVMSAVRTVDVAEEAAALDVGGFIAHAAGYAEVGDYGGALQERLRAAAVRGEFALIGPNSLGFESVRRRIRLTRAVRQRLKVGGLSIVSHSGAMLSAVAMAGNANGAGFNLLVSAGNEAVTDLADYLDYFADDPHTTGIGLVMEKIRRPEAFFSAVRHAIAAGKPVVALKLGRSERARQLALSHTAAVTGDAWAYDVALRQAGVSLAYDPEELADRLALVDKIPSERWSAVAALGVVVMSGGFASLTYDLASEEGLGVPSLEEFLPWVQERVPGTLIANPLDLTGLATVHWREIVSGYIESSEIDSFFVAQPMSIEDDNVRGWVRDVSESAGRVAKPVVLANVSGLPPPWLSGLESEHLAYGRGVRGTLRGLRTIGDFVRRRGYDRSMAESPSPVARPSRSTLESGGEELVGFGETMGLLGALGFPVADHVLIFEAEDPDDAEILFAEPFVVKLAELAHRTEIGAVRMDVRLDGLADAVRDLRDLAESHHVPPTVAVQPMVRPMGEALIGIDGTCELGPMVVVGLGGVFVEALNRVAGRIAPFDLAEARDLIDEFRDVKVMHGYRDRPAWDLDALARLLVKTSEFAAAGAEWIDSLDLNPVIFDGSRYVVVDALLLMKPEGGTFGGQHGE
jgi:acyl-CoA synthetase (NDP forming)